MNPTEWVRDFARRDSDPDQLRLQKMTALIVALSCCACGCLWSVIYLSQFGWGLVAALPLVFVVIVAAAVLLSVRLDNHLPLVYAQLICISAVTAALQWTIGGFSKSGAVVLWSFLAPVGALMFLPWKEALYWLGLFLGLLAISLGFDQVFATHGLEVAEHTRVLFFGMNLVAPPVVVFAAAAFFVKTIERERGKVEGLLTNMLPRSIAQRLKEGAGTIADAHHEVTVLFADIVGFTTYSSSVPPADLVSQLNAIFSDFDRLASELKIEKVKTIGDAYMVAAGVPDNRPDHAHAMAAMALEMLAVMRKVRRADGSAFDLRIGIHSGPVVAGVIGTSKFAYDLWGDTVNTASRMESHGQPGRIQVSPRTRELLGEAYAFEDRGEMEVKGKGRMHLYFLEGRKVA